MKKIVITIALVNLCAGSARASMVGAPADGQSSLTYTLYDDHQPPVGDPGTYDVENGIYGTYSIYTLDLGAQVVNGDVIVLENGPSTDKANWSDFLSFNNPDTYATLTSYDGPDPADFWADYTLSDNVVYIQETGGPYTSYTAVNDSGGSITYQITPQIHSVPEPTTMFAGALLLLPFGASTLRILRRRQMA